MARGFFFLPLPDFPPPDFFGMFEHRPLPLACTPSGPSTTASAPHRKDPHEIT